MIMEDPHKLDKERITEVINRLRGTGGLPLAPTYVKSLTAWMCTMAKRGYLDSDFLRDKDRVRETFMKQYPNPNSRAQFSRAILAYFSGLTDDEFQKEYSRLSRKDAVEAVRSVATGANKQKNDFFRKRT